MSTATRIEDTADKLADAMSKQNNGGIVNVLTRLLPEMAAK